MHLIVAKFIRLSIPGSHPYSPAESPNGEQIYYLAGDETRGAHLWRMDASGSGEHEKMLEGPLYLFQLTDDGFVYYTRYRESGLWRTLVEDTREPELVIEDLAGEDWQILGDWVYFASSAGIERFNLESGDRENVSAVTAYSLGTSISVHPNGHSILVSRTDRAESDLFLAQPVSRQAIAPSFVAGKRLSRPGLLIS